MEYLNILLKEYTDFFNFFLKEITFGSSPWYINYFYALTFISFFVYLLELIFPWRKNQRKIRKGFFLDLFYMYFNFFIFNMIFFSPFSAVIKKIFSDLNIDMITIIHSETFPYVFQILIFFLVLDFVQWITHISLHRIGFLWNFHKVHHSIKEMGFAGHLRYHWMENVVYTPVKSITIIIIGGFEPENVFILYYLTILIGHINHCNVSITYGPLKYLLNNPVMHLWHHAEYIPEKKYGVNYGISLSLWDFIFRTAYMKKDNRDIILGFKNIDKFPSGFLGQFLYPLFRKD